MVLTSCSIYNYKTIDFPKEKYKSASDFLDQRNLHSRKLDNSKFYFYDTLGRLFTAERGGVEDSLLKLLNVKKKSFHSSRNDRQMELKEDETHIFTSKRVNYSTYGTNQSRTTISIKPNEIDSIYKYPPKQVPINEFILKQRTVKDIFDQNGFSKNIDEWKFYINDLDDSTFECTNVMMNESTLSAMLIPVINKSKILQLNKNNQFQKNEVFMKINLRCTNKNPQIYLKSSDILIVESYMSQKDLDFMKSDSFGKILRTLGIIILSVLGLSILAFMGLAIALA